MTAFTSAGAPDLQSAGPGGTGGDSPDRPRAISATSSDYWLTFGGSLIGSLALVWLLYERILPFSGTIGFYACWYVAYLVVFATATAVVHNRLIVVDRLATAIVTGAAGLVGLALASTVGYTIFRGWAAVHHLNFFTQPESAASPLTAPLTQGGILNAIVGSSIELGIATLVSLPLGIGTAIYMVEVGGRFSRVVRTVVEAMTALPDILAGLFIYTFLILALGFQRSGFAAAMALSVMMLPVIARTADVQLRVVPSGLREASLALGATQWRTVWRVVIPTQLSGLATAVILGMARAVGETAPVLIASGFSTYTAVNPFVNPMNSLPLAIFTAVRSGVPLFITRGFGTGVVLLAYVLILFSAARLLARSKVARR
ncbi:MAG TPA: phosphate ABC transporter permease PstA [Streptosporangiaceae bacterium]|nr:phosphate ABC transporter permease PstA [Streptosporangiaceae bacterium]